MRHLIIGSGPAGVIAAETLRKAAPAAEITLLCGEGEPPYARMAIPYLLKGEIEEVGTHIRKDAGHYDRLRINLVQARARAIDTVNRTVDLGGGRSLPFDRLLIATGSHPSLETIPGMDLPGVHSCWTLEDARTLLAKAKPGTRIVQMGAGFVGCIIMEGLLSRGVDLTILVRSGYMVRRMMNPTASGMIRRWCEAKGVTILTRTQPLGITAEGGALRVALPDGRSLPADLYLSAVGVDPNLDFLAGSGIEIGRGMLNAPLDLFERVEGTLEELSFNYRLILVTKGDRFEQERKIVRSGLGKYFEVVEIVGDKTEASYRGMLATLGLEPKHFLMVGNSIRSDILPVLSMGGRAVYIPQENTWSHEIAVGVPGDAVGAEPDDDVGADPADLLDRLPDDPLPRRFGEPLVEKAQERHLPDAQDLRRAQELKIPAKTGPDPEPRTPGERPVWRCAGCRAGSRSSDSPGPVADCMESGAPANTATPPRATSGPSGSALLHLAPKLRRMRTIQSRQWPRAHSIVAVAGP